MNEVELYDQVLRYLGQAGSGDGPQAGETDGWGAAMSEDGSSSGNYQSGGERPSGRPEDAGSGEPIVVVEPVVDDAGGQDGKGLMSQVEQPAKVMRIGTMIKQLLEEVRAAPLDEAGRVRLREIHRSSIKELEDGLSDDLREELDRLTLPFDDSHVPSEAELRIAQAQLVGWLEGLFHGIQTALFAQQMAARAQLEQMRGRALPGQVGPGPGLPGLTPQLRDGEHGTGQYL